MKIDDVVSIPDSMRTFKIGLGWKTTLDIDCSLLLFDELGNPLETLYSRNIKLKLKSPETLENDGIDDEDFTINLDKISEDCVSIWPVITINTHGSQFDNVTGAYCRIFDEVSKTEFARFSLLENKDQESNGNIMGNFSRTSDGGWFFKARGYYTRNTTMSRNM